MIRVRIFQALPNLLQRLVLKILKTMVKEWKSETLRAFWESTYGIKVGMGSYGCFQRGIFCAGDKIGNYCSIAANVWHLHANHPMDHGSMSPLFYLKSFGDNPNAVDVARTALTVGNDVWIGRDVKILANVTKIGNGAVIGAGSIVTKDVEPYTLVAGNPARVIRRRFDDETIAKLEDSEWWTLPPEELMKLQNVVQDPCAFADAAKKLVENC